MLSRIKVLGVFLVVPVICYFVLQNSVSKWDTAWEKQVRQSVSADRVAEFSLSAVCLDPQFLSSPDFSEACERYGRTGLFLRLSVGAGVATLGFFVSLILAGHLSKSNRALLLKLFKPGLVLSHILVAGLLLFQAALLSGTFIYGMNEGQIDETTTFYSWLFGLAASAGAFFIIRPLFTRETIQSAVIGRVIRRSPDSRLWAFVEELAEKIGTHKPVNVVVGLSPEFFVTEADVRCLDGGLTGRTLYLSAPLCRILTKQELAAVVSHELGHFRGEDTAFTLHFYPIYRQAGDALRGVHGTADKMIKTVARIPIAAFKLIGIAASLSLYPAMYMMRFFLDCFALAESSVSRSRELTADAVAAEAAGARNLASALIKVTAFSAVWHHVSASMQESIQQGYFESGSQRLDARAFFSNASEVFAVTVASTADASDLNGLDTRVMAHPVDSHPPLGIRLLALKQPLESVGVQALDLMPDSPAFQIIDDCEAIEIQLSRAMQEMIGPPVSFPVR